MNQCTSKNIKLTKFHYFCRNVLYSNIQALDEKRSTIEISIGVALGQ
jgi:hypothetical protein